jgi:multicomponent K+:H+ antiporter subunit G
MTEVGGGWVEVLASIVTLLGAFLFLASAIGLLRLPDLYTRVHAPTKAATLGVALLGSASLLRSLPSGDLVWIEDLLIVVFLVLTVPVSSQVLLRAAATRKVDQTPETRGRPATRESLPEDEAS